MSLIKSTAGFFSPILCCSYSVGIVFMDLERNSESSLRQDSVKMPQSPRPLKSGRETKTNQQLNNTSAHPLSWEHFDPHYSLHGLVCERDVPRHTWCSRKQNKRKKWLHKPPRVLLGSLRQDSFDPSPRGNRRVIYSVASAWQSFPNSSCVMIIISWWLLATNKCQHIRAEICLHSAAAHKMSRAHYTRLL